MVFITLRVRAPSEWYFDNGCSRHMIGDKSFFTSFEDFNGGNATFDDGRVVLVRCKGSIVIPKCPELNDVLLLMD